MLASRSAFAAVLALAAVVFSQLAIAAAAWDSPPSPCHELAPAANFCFQHCNNNDLTLDIPRIKLPEPQSVAAAVSVVVPAPIIEVPRSRLAVLAAGPPARILFQSFLN